MRDDAPKTGELQAIIDRGKFRPAENEAIGYWFARYLTINWTYPQGEAPIGAAAFDLRGIGVDATLVLVNGFRIAPYGQAAENIVDVNSIPVSAIERIDARFAPGEDPSVQAAEVVRHDDASLFR